MEFFSAQVYTKVGKPSILETIDENLTHTKLFRFFVFTDLGEISLVDF